MTTITTAAQLPAEKRKPLVISALVAIALGLLAIAMPFFAGVAATYFLAANFVIGGVLMVSAALGAKAWSGSVALMLLGIVSIVGGIFIFAHPLIGMVSLTLVCIAAMFASGIAMIFWAFNVLPGEGRWFLVFSGVVSVVIAAALFAAFPLSALWAFGVLVGINLLAQGVSLWVFAQSRG